MLEDWYRKVNRPEFVNSDPVLFPRRFSDPADIEIAAFLAGVIAWGRRDLILKSGERLFSLLRGGPFAFVMAGRYRSLRNRRDCPSGACIHRTFFEEDLAYFCRGLRACYQTYGSLEALFSSALNRPGSPDSPGDPGIWEGMALFRETMAQGNGGRYTKHIADPHSGSPCKRLCLSLRWLVRREGPVDLGLWTSVSPAALYIPLDLHVGRAARQLGLLDPARKANDRKAATALTAQLREFCPEDPARYDLALFGWGMENAGG
ncbi:MAG: TIGR02757 family protein [Treponema sp.]|jgi:uncharacterized protein (TIGR02757 family)|nr:TIGR02757 family protein [Treponema sp.]